MKFLILLFPVIAAHLAFNNDVTEIYGLNWVVSSNGGVPMGAFVAGNNGNESLYVCRVYYDEHLVIGEGVV